MISASYCYESMLQVHLLDCFGSNQFNLQYQCLRPTISVLYNELTCDIFELFVQQLLCAVSKYVTCFDLTSDGHKDFLHVPIWSGAFILCFEKHLPIALSQTVYDLIHHMFIFLWHLVYRFPVQYELGLKIITAMTNIFIDLQYLQRQPID